MSVRFLFFASFLALGISPARAATVAPVTFEQLVVQSSHITRGEVIATNSRWNDSRTTIVTDVRLRTLESFKGSSSELVFTQIGGTVGKLKVSAEGVAPFVVGDEVIVFVKPVNDGLQLTGATQGRFDVVTDPRNGQKLVRGLVQDTTVDKSSGSPQLQDLKSFSAKLQQQIVQPDESSTQGGQ